MIEYYQKRCGGNSKVYENEKVRKTLCQTHYAKNHICFTLERMKLL